MLQKNIVVKADSKFCLCCAENGVVRQTGESNSVHFMRLRMHLMDTRKALVFSGILGYTRGWRRVQRSDKPRRLGCPLFGNPTLWASIRLG